MSDMESKFFFLVFNIVHSFYTWFYTCKHNEIIILLTVCWNCMLIHLWLVSLNILWCASFLRYWCFRLQRRISLMMFLHNADNALEEYPSIIKIRPNAVGLSVSQRVFYFNFFLDF